MKYDKPLSKFALKFNLRRYNEAHFDGLTFEEEKGWAVVSGVRNNTPASSP